MRKNIDSIRANLTLIEIFEPVIAMANTDVLLSAIDLLCHSRGGRTVGDDVITSFLNERKKYFIEGYSELKSHGFILRIDESAQKEEK